MSGRHRSTGTTRPVVTTGPVVRLVTAGVTATLALTGLTVLTTGAVFTGNAANDNNTFSSGTVVLSTNPTSTLYTASNLAPGDVRYASLQVQSTGSLALRYAMTTTATDDAGTTGDDRNLAAALRAEIRTGVSTCDATGWSTGTAITMRNAAGSQPVGGTAETPVIGDKATGNQTGDRALGASSSETLCFQVTLPSSATESVQGMTTKVTFSFFGEQTANNP